MYNITTKRGGYNRVQRAARMHANAAPTLNTDAWFGRGIAEELQKMEQRGELSNNFLGKKITNAVINKVIKVQSNKAKKAGVPDEEIDAAKENLREGMKSPEFQKNLKRVNTIADAAIIIGAVAGGAAAAGVGAAGAGATAAGGSAAGGTSAGTIGAIGSAGATGAKVIGSEIKNKSAVAPTNEIFSPRERIQDMVEMPDKTSIAPIIGPIAGQALQASGQVVESKTDKGKVAEFVDKIVGPQTGKQLKNLAGDVAENAALDFLSTIRNKKLNGEKLPAALDKTASLMINAEDKARKKVQAGVNMNIGEWVTQNWWVILIALGILWFAASRSKKSGR